MEDSAETVSLFLVSGSFSLACRQVRGGGGGCRTPGTKGGGIGHQPAAQPQHCCSALTWAPVPGIYSDLLVHTNRIRVADKAGALCSPGLPAATLPQRGGPGSLGPSCVAVKGCTDKFLHPVFCGRFLSIVPAMCFPVWLLLTAQMVPLAFVAVEWAARVHLEVACSMQLYFYVFYTLFPLCAFHLDARFGS